MKTRLRKAGQLPPAETRGGATVRPKAPRPVLINRAARPLHLMTNRSPEETGYPTGEAAHEINPETGRTRLQDYIWKWGHGQNLPLEQRIRMEQHKAMSRLSPQLRELKKHMTLFLHTPQEQRDDIVPMPPTEFVGAMARDKDGAHFRRKVEQEMAELEPVIEAVYAYYTALKEALATAPDVATVAPAPVYHASEGQGEATNAV